MTDAMKPNPTVLHCESRPEWVGASVVICVYDNRMVVTYSDQNQVELNAALVREAMAL